MAHRGEISGKGAGGKLADIILGGQDGLVGALGIILGVAAASNDVRIVIAGGLAATFAESISMAAVALTSKMAERDHFAAELEREKREMNELPEKEADEIRKVYKDKGFDGKILDDIVAHVTADDKLWLDLMMKEELELTEIKKKDIYTGGLIVGGSTFLGSIIPLVAFFFFPMHESLYISLILSAVVLFLVGVYKAKVTIGKPFKSGLQLMIIGMAAALAGYLVGRLFG